MNKLGRLVAIAGCTIPLLGGASAPNSDAPILEAMKDELARTTKDLRLPSAGAPYYVGYWVVDETVRDIEATLGALVSDVVDRDRFVRTELRVGSRAFDNSNFSGVTADGDVEGDTEAGAPSDAALDDDVSALRRELWLASDAAYKDGVEALERKRAAKESEVTPHTEVPSFSDERSATLTVKDEPVQDGPDPADLARHVSAVFRGFPEVDKSSVHVLQSTARRRFIASDGGLVVEPSRLAAMEITCETQADDGMSVERSAFVASKNGGPLPEDVAIDEARRVARDLVALKNAPIAEDHSGPVLFEGRAAAELAYELLGDSLSGTPAPEGNDELESALSHKLGKHVMPSGFSVVDDPGLTVFDGVPLLGHYAVDDEGIAAERVTLVDDGRLKGFLMSRAPRQGVDHSNGHGRSGLVGWARGKPANLVVTTKNGLSKKALRERLLEAVREQDADYGIVVTDLEPRTTASSGDMVPTPELLYKVTPDGKQTLLRGGELASLSVRDLRDILAAGHDAAVYSFVSESDGGLDTAVSVVAPALLFEDLDVRAPTGPNKKPPLVPRPTVPAAK